ncbi:MAG: sigma-70 family RNA polymerase sigma factor [Anaerolineae bacterium]|nr:sigma-70 family RNA polymerase sigma factor [Anaerolineae bacterium]
MQDELLLLHRVRALEPEALAEVHDTYYVPIYRYIIVRVNDPVTAEDLASEVFTRLLSALRDHTAPQNTLRGWLFSVASHIVKDHYRKQYRAPQTDLHENIPSTSNSPETHVDMKLDKEALHNAVTTLSEDQQNVIALRFGFGMSIHEAAKTIGKSEGSVKMLQARAIKNLSKKLKPGWVES